MTDPLHTVLGRMVAHLQQALRIDRSLGALSSVATVETDDLLEQFDMEMDRALGCFAQLDEAGVLAGLIAHLAKEHRDGLLAADRVDLARQSGGVVDV